MKPGVIYAGLQPEIWYAIGIWDAISREVAQQPAVITSGTDGNHCHDSLHYVGRAVDLRTRDYEPNERAAIQSKVYDILCPIGYDMLPEVDHTHISYPPTKGKLPWLLATAQAKPQPAEVTP